MDNGVDLSVDYIKVKRSTNTTEEPGTSSTVESGTSASLIVKPGPSNSSVEEPEARNDDEVSVSSGRSTPDSSCSICLGAMVNKSFTDSCMHQFCFTCLKQWSKVKAQCPLCKQNFKAIYYNVRSIEDYQQYVLPLPPPPRPTFVMVNFPGQEENIDVYRRRMNTEAAAVRSYLDYVVSLETSMNSHTLPTTRFRSHLRRTRANPSTTSSFRRNIYQQGLWVQRQTDVTGRIRECSPEFYRVNPTMVHRLVPWLNRELNVLCGSNSQTVMSVILDLILRVPIRSPEFATAIAPHIGRHTEHFVHEFHSYATTPYDLIGYDREASYVQQDALAHNMFRPLSTSSEDDVQEVTHSWTTPPVIPINVASDSDDCVIVDSVQAQRPRTPEVITLESDDDLQIVSTSSTSQKTHPTYLLRPKRTLLSSLPESRRRRLNVSININLPGPSHSRAGSSHRRKHRYIPSPDMESSSSSDLSPNRRLSMKMSKKKQKSGLRSKDKTPVEEHERSPQKEVLDLENESSSSEGFPSCALPLKKRRQRPVVLKSSSDDEPSVLQIDAEPDLLALVEPEIPPNKPRLRSVVVKPEVKTETLDVSDLPSSSFHDLPEVKIENKYFVKTFPSCDSDSSNTSDSSCCGSKRRFSKNRTSSKQRKYVGKL